MFNNFDRLKSSSVNFHCAYDAYDCWRKIKECYTFTYF